MNSSVVGLDIAKNIFHMYSIGVDNQVIKKKLKRAAGVRRLGQEISLLNDFI
jgi:hypothetical protein